MIDPLAQENMRQMRNLVAERFRADFMALTPKLQHELQGRDPETLTMRQMMDIEVMADSPIPADIVRYASGALN